MKWVTMIVDFVKSFFGWRRDVAQAQEASSNEKAAELAAGISANTADADTRTLESQTNGTTSTDELIRRAKEHDARERLLHGVCWLQPLLGQLHSSHPAVPQSNLRQKLQSKKQSLYLSWCVPQSRSIPMRSTRAFSLILRRSMGSIHSLRSSWWMHPTSGML